MGAGRPSDKASATAIRGPVKARRAGTTQIGGHEVLHREAEERLFQSPEVMSEGTVRTVPDGACWFGSTMITVGLADLAPHWRGPLDDEARARLVTALDGSVRVHLRAMRLACAEVARRLPDRPLGTAQVDTRVRIVGDQLHLDVDVEVPLGVSSAQGQR